MTLYWLATLSVDLVLLFGEQGLLPPEVVRRLTPVTSAGRYSFLHWMTSPAALWAAHTAALVVVALFTVGLFTRVTSVLTLVVLLAYVHRVWMITGIVEPVLAFGLYYLCFAPCGAYFSLDAWRRKRAMAAPPLLSLGANIATRLLQIHTALVYFMMGITMLSSPFQTWWSGEAMWFLIARPESRMIDLTWMDDHINLLNFWTHCVVSYELAFAILVWNRWARPVILLLGIPHWCLLALVSGLAPFCLTMLALNLAFMPPARARTP
jgi:hypothetical protein